MQKSTPIYSDSFSLFVILHVHMLLKVNYSALGTLLFRGDHIVLKFTKVSLTNLSKYLQSLLGYSANTIFQFNWQIKHFLTKKSYQNVMHSNFNIKH